MELLGRGRGERPVVEMTAVGALLNRLDLLDKAKGKAALV